MDRILCDTGVLLRFVSETAPHHERIRQTVLDLLADSRHLVTTTQNIREFWCVATRPIDVNGFGLSISRAERAVRSIESVINLLPDTMEVHERWQQIVIDY